MSPPRPHRHIFHPNQDWDLRHSPIVAIDKRPTGQGRDPAVFQNRCSLVQQLSQAPQTRRAPWASQNPNNLLRNDRRDGTASVKSHTAVRPSLFSTDTSNTDQLGTYVLRIPVFQACCYRHAFGASAYRSTMIRRGQVYRKAQTHLASRQGPGTGRRGARGVREVRAWLKASLFEPVWLCGVLSQAPIRIRRRPWARRRRRC